MDKEATSLTVKDLAVAGGALKNPVPNHMAFPGLPSRWHTLRYNPEQQRLWTEDKRFKVIAAGRDCGKSELAKRKLVISLAEKKPWPDPRYFLVVPSHKEAGAVWRDLLALMPEEWVRQLDPFNLRIKTTFGSELRVLHSGNFIEQTRGALWDGGIIDECKLLGKEFTRLKDTELLFSDRKGWCWFIERGFYAYAETLGDPNYGVYSWIQEDIGHNGRIPERKD